MVERDPDLVGTISIAEDDLELVFDELAAVLSQDRRTTGETCALLLAADARGASDSEAVRKHAAKDRDAAAAERVANQDRQRIERSEVIQWEEVSAAKLAGGENQTKPVSGTAQRAALAT